MNKANSYRKDFIPARGAYSTLLFIILISVIFIHHPAFAANTGKIDYDAVYNGMPVLDFSYEHNEDPDELQDYEKYVGSPYPLVRISLRLSCKDARLKPGYYLMTPRNRNGYDFMMFKENGKIITMVPVYEKQLVNPEAIYPAKKKPKGFMQKVGGGVKNAIATPFKPFMRPQPVARYAIDGGMVEAGRYFELWLYRQEYLYKMLFKIDK